jgi:hypothetical protein
MIRASKTCGALCWIFLVAIMTTSLQTPAWLMVGSFAGFLLCAISAFLFYTFAQRGTVPKSKVGLYVAISAVVVAVILFILPLLG